MATTRVLLIDDEVAFTRVLKLYLEKTGRYEVQTANRGTEGIAAARDFLPDVILLDIIMPDVNGERVAAQLKADARLQHIPIVFLTATMSRPPVGEPGEALGVPRLTKPVSGKEVVNYLEQSVGRG